MWGNRRMERITSINVSEEIMIVGTIPNEDYGPFIEIS